MGIITDHLILNIQVTSPSSTVNTLEKVVKMSAKSGWHSL